MVEVLFGSTNKERILIFLKARREGYAREIARFFEVDLDPIQKQLERLENGGVIYSRKAGRTLLFAFNPRYPFLKELYQILDKVLSLYPPEIHQKLVLNRRRPRRRGKPL